MVDVNGVLYQANALASIGKSDDAIAMLGAALEEQPDNAALLTQLAHVLLDVERYDEAKRAAQSALAIKPKSEDARLLLASMALRQNDAPGAQRIAESVLDDSPQSVDAHLYLALALASGTWWKKAVRIRAREAYHFVLANSPSPVSYYWAAQIEKRLNNLSLAKEHVDAGLSIDPNDAGLLSLKADSSTTAEQLSILGGLLAVNPMDRSSRQSISEIFQRSRRGRYTLQWAAVFWLAVAAATTAGWWTAGAFLGVWLLTIVIWGVRLNTMDDAPPGFVAARQNSYRFRVLVSNLSFWWLVLTLAGSILLATGIALGVALLMLALLFWACSLAAISSDDARQAMLDSPLGGSGDNRVPSGLRDLAWYRRNVDLLSSAGLVVLAVAVLGIHSLGGFAVMDASAIAILCLTAATVYLVEGLVFTGVLRPKLRSLARWLPWFVLVGVGIVGVFSFAAPRLGP